MKDIVKKIENIFNLVCDMNSSYSENLKELFSNRSIKIPTELYNVFMNSGYINTNSDSIFLGYEALSEEDALFEYKNKSNPLSFFGAYDYKKDFILNEDMYIYFEDSLTEELEESVSIKDISVLIPLFKFQGDYIVTDMRTSSFKNLVIISDGHIASVLAPSIKEHLIDLIEGINEGSYYVIDDEIIFPSSWHLRKKVRSGKLKMDKYGECE